MHSEDVPSLALLVLAVSAILLVACGGSTANDQPARLDTTQWAAKFCDAVSTFNTEFDAVSMEHISGLTVAERKRRAAVSISQLRTALTKSRVSLAALRPPADAEPLHNAMLSHLTKFLDAVDEAGKSIETAQAEADIARANARVNRTYDAGQAKIDSAFENAPPHVLAALHGVTDCIEY